MSVQGIWYRRNTKLDPDSENQYLLNPPAIPNQYLSDPPEIPKQIPGNTKLGPDLKKL